MVGNVNEFELFCWVVEAILQRDWNTSLAFSNVSSLKLENVL